MTHSLVSRPAVLACLAGASATVHNTDKEIANLQAVAESLRQKTVPLREQIDELRAAEPVISGPDKGQVEALVNNPNSAVDVAAITEVVAVARAEADVTSMAIATVQAAIDRIDAQCAETEKEIEALRTRRDIEFRDFAAEMQLQLGSILQRDFARLRDEIMLPLLAVSKLRASDGRADLLGVRDPGATRFSSDSRITLERFQFGGDGRSGKWHPEELLFAADSLTSRAAEDVVKSFRNVLAALAPDASSRV